ncbi:MAG TPA: lipopolysaccharide biosynthesis protein [Steroidobacteraceae bacterium]|nr:lipopolysaccharide biosynthesis protein [Steroidobacteraceae bacterium]
MTDVAGCGIRVDSVGSAPAIPWDLWHSSALNAMSQPIEAYFEEHRVSNDLGHRAVRGGIVSILMQYGNGGFQIIGAIILARILTPSDFGLVAIITVLTNFVPLLIDFGLGDATTQRSKINPGQVSSLFWITSGVGAAVAVVIAACSPLIASVYHEPRLEAIALVSAITFVLWGLSNQHLALLRRTMQFGRIAKIQLMGTLVGNLVAVALALVGGGYWALVVRPIANALWVAVGAWRGCPWRPGTPVLDAEVKSMTRFGMHVMGFSITYSVAKSVDRILLALFYRPAIVGYYQNATTLYENSIFMALAQVHTVGSAALSKLQSDPAALAQRYEAALSTLAFFVMPLAVILSVTGEDVTVLLLGSKWRTAGWLLRIIALRGIFQVIESSQGWLHLSIGRADRWRNWGVVTLVVQIVAVLAGLHFGAEGVAIACVIAIVLIAIPSVSYAGRPIGVGSAVVIRAVGPQLLGAMSATAAGTWLQMSVLSHLPSIVRIIVSTSFCTCLYLIIVVGVFRLSEPLRVARSVVRGRLRGHQQPSSDASAS